MPFWALQIRKNMNHINNYFLNLSTYGITTAGIVVNFENIKGGVLFVLGVFLLILQIKIHLIRLKKEKNAKNI